MKKWEYVKSYRPLAQKSIERQIKNPCLGLEILVFIIAESGKWQVEGDFKDPLSAIDIRPCSSKEVVGYDYGPGP